MENPKTRQEKKSKGPVYGRYKDVYNQKHIRCVCEKKGNAGSDKPAKVCGKKK